MGQDFLGRQYKNRRDLSPYLRLIAQIAPPPNINKDFYNNSPKISTNKYFTPIL